MAALAREKAHARSPKASGAAAAMSADAAMAASMARPSDLAVSPGSRLMTETMLAQAHQAGKKSRTKVPNSGQPGSPWMPWASCPTKATNTKSKNSSIQWTRPGARAGRDFPSMRQS